MGDVPVCMSGRRTRRAAIAPRRDRGARGLPQGARRDPVARGLPSVIRWDLVARGTR